MTIVLVGGGSGGHITPLLAVARELRRIKPKVHLVYIGERGGKFTAIASDSGLFDEFHYIYAGKMRRYHGESVIRRILDIKTILLNLRDLLYLVIGTIQAILLFQKLQSRGVLLKGGFVCVPVAFASKLHNVPVITHDSDAVPGLSNRVAGRYAKIHAVAMPAQYYTYPKDSICVVGVPINPEFSTHTKATNDLKIKYGLKAPGPVILITGGSQGSRRLNTALIEILPNLVKKYPKIHIFHHVGIGNDDQYPPLDSTIQKHITTFNFSDVLYEMSALSDIVVTRAGATTLAEFASQRKPCIVIPHPELAGDHQTKNAKVYGDADACMVLSEEKIRRDSNLLFDAISDILSDDKKRKRYAENIRSLNPSTPSAVALANLVFELSGTK